MTQEELRKEHLRLKGQTNELKQQNKELKSAADERNELLAKVRRDKKLFMAEQAELQRASQEMQSAIKRLLSEKNACATRPTGSRESLSRRLRTTIRADVLPGRYRER